MSKTLQRRSQIGITTLKEAISQVGGILEEMSREAHVPGEEVEQFSGWYIWDGDTMRVF